MERLPKKITIPNTVERQSELQHEKWEGRPEDLFNIKGDFEKVGKKLKEVVDVGRETTIAETLGRVDSTIGEITSAGLMDNFPGLEESALKLHTQADNILSQ